MGILSSEREDDEDLKRPGEEQYSFLASPTVGSQNKELRASAAGAARPFAAALEEALQGGQGDAKRLVQAWCLAW